ncbi:MAG: tripartite tricarboxylate transporter substrate binding protein [Gemmatimonadaceae bacterium]|nr:tripartite tricarboxylate transporter substrate binding protein [Gemmatimonadaceae bacterium]
MHDRTVYARRARSAGVAPHDTGATPCFTLTLGIAATLACALAHAQPDFPNRPVRIVVPQAVGASIDIAARIVGQRMQEGLGQPVVIENRPGANAIIGMEVVAKSKPDGHVLVMAPPSAVAINPLVFKQLPYDTLRDFAPVSQVSGITFVVVVNPALPVQTLKDLATLARKRPGELAFGSSGMANMNHLSGELFSQLNAVKLLHVPYKGETPAVSELIAGNNAVMFTTLPSVLPFIRSGRLRAVAVLGEQRSAVLPEVPTATEAGMAGIGSSGWTGLLAPAGTQADTVQRLSREVARVVKLPDVTDGLAKQGADPVGSTPEQFTAFIKSEIAKWNKVVRQSGIELSQ